MDHNKLRGWWAAKQGLLDLDRSLGPAEVFEKSGWSRSVGGCNPYLTALSRAGLDRAPLDKAAALLELSELPAARGCTYVVPRDEFGLALACGGLSAASGDVRMALSLGATLDELSYLSERVLEALVSGPKDPAALKLKLGDAVRHFGDAGKKKGLTSSLPIALGALQSRAQIVRRPVNGRLDEQRYAYEIWPTDLPISLPTNPMRDLALRFFRWIGPARVSGFASLSGLSLKAARAAISELELVAPPSAPEHLLLREELDAFESFAPPIMPVYRVVGTMDSAILLHDEYGELLSQPGLEKLHKLQGTEKHPGVVKELGFNAILDRGRIVGVWEYDPEVQKIVFVRLEESSEDLDREVQSVEEWIAGELGDARTFSLDSPKSRKPKLERLRIFTAAG